MTNLLLRKAKTLFSIVWGFASRAFRLQASGVNPRGGSIRLSRHNFDADWYLEQYPDLKIERDAASRHFFHSGVEEGKQGRFFDTGWYFASCTDLSPWLVDGFTHYRRWGIKEGREARFIYVNVQTLRPPSRSYEEWLSEYDTPATHPDAVALSQKLDLHAMICFVLLAPRTLDDLPSFLATLESIRTQSFVFFEAVIGVMADTDAAVAAFCDDYICKDSRFTRADLDSASDVDGYRDLVRAGQYAFLGFVVPGCRLHPDAAFWFAVERKSDWDADLFYADEDAIDDQGRRSSPYFKPDFNYELLLSHNYFGSCVIINRRTYEQLGGLSGGFAAVEQAIYDLCLRLVETPGASIRHIPRVLTHQRAAERGMLGGAGAVGLHLERTGKAAKVLRAEVDGYVRVRFALPRQQPKVSIIIPTRDRVDLLSQCVSSILEKTNYRNYEIIIVDNGSREPATLEYLNTLDIETVKVVRDDSPFNYSALNNRAVQEASGAYICLMNNDIEVISWDWLDEMMSFAVQDGVGCVGARLWYPDGRIQHAGVLLGFHGVAGHVHKFLPKGAGGYCNRAVLHQTLSAVTAACLVVEKRIYEEVGGLDEDLAVAFNDVDFCLKVRDRGYRNVYTPYAELFHHESASRGKDRSRKQKRRAQAEIDIIKARYGDALRSDPTYNPNLTLILEDMSLAFPPRLPLSHP